MAEVSFGDWLKRRRSLLGLTQEQLALQIHCSTSALRKFESEERRPSAEVVSQLAGVFNIPAEEHESFLRFARGDWQAFAGSDTKQTPWHLTTLDRQSNLPSLITSFIGRGKEQDDVIDLLRKNRLVTIAGTGGIGKTRLAIQVGNRLLHDYRDGVWFIPLDSLSDPLLVPQTAAAAFDIQDVAERPIIETLKHVLREKTALLILDNCEHLLDACTQFSATLLAHCLNLRILTTSREILNIEGEATYSLPSLSMPVDSAAPDKIATYEAVQLFVERAGLALSSFKLDDANAQSVLEICRRVDGLPLAIELTAARVNVLNVAEISQQLNKSFALLASDHRTTLSRHQTLQASLDWSWSLLSDSEQVFVRQLSVFAGGWTLEAAESVCDGNALNLTSMLVQKSLIKVEQKAERETRYYFHEMVRQYGREKLLEAGGVESVRGKHLAYFVKLVEQAEPELYRPNQLYWLKKLDDEVDNLRMAMHWALETDVTAGLRIAVIPARFWYRRDYLQEVGIRLGQLLESYPTADSLRAHALAVHSNYVFLGGRPTEARMIAEQGLQLARAFSDQRNEALCLLFLGKIIAVPGDHQEGIALFEQSLAIYRALGDKIGQATATWGLAIHHNDPEQAKSLLLESLKLHRDLGNLYDIAFCLTHLSRQAIYGGDFSSPSAWLEEAGTLFHKLGAQPDEGDVINIFGLLAYCQGNYQQSLSYYKDAIILNEKVGTTHWATWPRAGMAYTFSRMGDYQQASELFEVSLRQFQKDDHVIGVVFTVEGLASLYVNQEKPERATQLFAWADAMREKLGNSRPPVEQMDINKSIEVCLAQLGEEAFTAAYEEGKKMSQEEAIAYALKES